MLGTNTVLVDLLDQGHDELGLDHNGVTLAVTVNHVHGVQLVLATGFQRNNRGIGTQGRNQCAVLVFRVTDQDFILGGKQNISNLLFGEEGLACTRNTQQHGGLVQQVLLIAENKVIGDCVLTIVHTALVLDLLHLKGHEHSQGFGSESAERIDLPDTDRQNGFQSVHLLIIQGGNLTHAVLCDGL